MQVDIRHRPAFAAMFVHLDAGDSIVAESDAMASMASNVDMSTRMNGGLLKAPLRKFFGRESFFVNEFSCPTGDNDGADMVLTQATPGDIQCLELAGTSMYMQPGAYLASEPAVQLGLGWAGFRSWFGREGLFRLKVSGNGRIWFGAYGGLYEHEVDGEYVVDTSHLVAYEPTLSMRVGLAGGVFSSFFGGEGFVSRLLGRGKIWMQTRSVDGLASWTNAHLI